MAITRTLFVALTASLAMSLAAEGALDQRIDSITVRTSLTRCALNNALLALGTQAHLLIGFESFSECFLRPDATESDAAGQNFTNVSPRELLDSFIERLPEYEWRDMAGVVVVRPAGGWKDPDNLLNAPARPISIENGLLSDGLAALLHTEPHPVDDYPSRSLMRHEFSMNFETGSVMEGLNALIRAHGGAMWGATIRPRTDGRLVLAVVLWTHDRPDAWGQSISVDSPAR